MDFETWKQNLVNEIETAASACAERSLADMNDPTFANSQKALFAMAQSVKNLPADTETLKDLFEEEKELNELMRAVP
ncbi:MAG: hypothetical protein KIT00_09120, partial [Rhodospirillales bacterium]|nr:hypothetical protein [Rhodospirillales bacterium]